MKVKLAFAIIALSATAGAFAQSGKLAMKAIVVHQYGGPEALKYEDAPRPEPKEDEMLVRVCGRGG